MGTIGYDACIDSGTMCLSLSWTDGLDPDLHSYYFPDWTYNEETKDKFTDATCDYNNDPTITHDANTRIIAGMTVTGTGIPANATVASVTSTTVFELSASTTGGAVTNGTLTFNSFDNTSRGLRYWVYSNAANKTYSATGDTIHVKDAFTDTDNETQVWATDSQKVGNGTYLFYVEDVSEIDVQNFKLVLSGPGLSDNITYGPYDFKEDGDNSTTEAVNPQAVFFIQV